MIFLINSNNLQTDSTNEEIQLSTCLVCGKKDRSIEFILPDRYCSQSCADQHGYVPTPTPYKADSAFVRYSNKNYFETNAKKLVFFSEVS